MFYSNFTVQRTPLLTISWLHIKDFIVLYERVSLKDWIEACLLSRLGSVNNKDWSSYDDLNVAIVWYNNQVSNRFSHAVWFCG